MRFGLRLLQHLGSAHELIQLAVLAEQAGFDQVWFPHDTFMKNTWVLTSAVALRTSRIGIGSLATNPYLTDPAEIATYLATLDELSQGRATIGIGMHTGEMVAWTGKNPEDHLDRTREAVDILRALLRGEVVAYAGAAYQWTKSCYLRFKPLRAEIPIYVAAFGEAYLELSGAIGDGSLPMLTPPESAGLMVGPIRRGIEEAGRATEEVDIAGCLWLSLAEERREAADTLRPIVAYFGPYLEEQALQTIGLSQSDFAPIKDRIARKDDEAAAAAVTEAMLRLAIVGDPNDVMKRLEMLQAEGVTQANLGGPLGPDPAAAIRLMGERVIPHFRST